MRSYLKCIFLYLSAFSVLMTVVIPVVSLASKMGANAVEWTRIINKGWSAGSIPLEWTDWSPSDGTVSVIPLHENAFPPRPVTEFRIGTGQSWLFHFNFYEGRYRRDNGQWHVVPARGPLWGAQIHWHWTWIALGLAGFSLAGLLLFNPGSQPPVDPTHPLLSEGMT